jgi:hypothetical protein
MTLDCLKSGLFQLTPAPFGIILSEVEQWAGYLRESLNKMSVEVGKAQEGLYFLFTIWCWPFCNPCNLYWVHFRLSVRDDEAQVFDLGLCKLALVVLEIEFVLSELF